MNKVTENKTAKATTKKAANARAKFETTRTKALKDVARLERAAAKAVAVAATDHPAFQPALASDVQQAEIAKRKATKGTTAEFMQALDKIAALPKTPKARRELAAIEAHVAQAKAADAADRKAAKGTTAAPKTPREGSKKALVIAQVESAEGASRKALATATGWSEPFVTGFMNWTVKRHLAATGRTLAAAKDKATGDWNYRVA